MGLLGLDVGAVGVRLATETSLSRARRRMLVKHQPRSTLHDDARPQLIKVRRAL